MFKTYRDKAILRQQQAITGTKHPVNYEAERTENNELEQKPIKNFNEFRDGEEKNLSSRYKNEDSLNDNSLKKIKQKK